LSIDVVRERIKVLIERKLIEKWTVKSPEHYKKTYYRIVYWGDKRILYSDQKKKEK